MSLRSRVAALAAVTAATAGLAALVLDARGQTGPVPLSAPPTAALAPTPTASPDGRVLDLVADRPEGLAVDPARGVLVVDTRASTGLVLSLPGLAPAGILTLPGSGRHVSTYASLALVPSEDAGQLAVAELGADKVRSVRVGRAPHDVAVLPGGRALVGAEVDGAVSVVSGLDDPATARTTQTLPAGLQPGGLAADGDLACAVDVRGRYLYVYDATAGQPVRPAGRVAVGKGPTHVVDLGGGFVAVADALGKAIVVVRLDHPEVVGRTSLGQSPEGLAVDPVRHRLWVSTPADNQLSELRISGHSLERVDTFATVQQPNSVAVDARTGLVYVAGAIADGQLQVLTPTT